MSCCITPISLIQIQVGNAWFNHVPICSASTQSLRKETTYIIWRTHWSVTGEKNECFGCRHTVISDKQKWFRMALFLYWGLPSPHQVGRDVVVLLLLLHCTASLLTPKHTQWCAEFTRLPCTGVTRLCLLSDGVIVHSCVDFIVIHLGEVMVRLGEVQWFLLGSESWW